MKITFPQDVTPSMVIHIKDERFGLIGYVVVDRTVNGSASGGVRYAQDVSVDELSNLARAMTYKWAFLNRSMGGAKGGIIVNEQTLGVPRAELMQAFGRAIAPLIQHSVYLPGVDLGTTLSDLREIMRGAGKPLPESQIDGSQATAMTAFETIQQLFAVNETSVAGKRVALEGFGKVGGYLAQLLQGVGAVIVALSTIAGGLYNKAGLDIEELLRLRETFGDDLIHHYQNADCIDSDAIYTVDVDLLVPGARTAVIHEGNAASIRARWIVPVANYPITPPAEKVLLERGVCILPDFVANSGGIMASAMWSNSFDIEDVQHYIETCYAELLRELFLKAKKIQQPVTLLARQVAWENHLRLNQGQQTAQGFMLRLAKVRQSGISIITRRVAWRLHQRGVQGKYIKSLALESYAEMTVSQLYSIIDKMSS